MKKILVTGSTGQLGSDVVKELYKKGYNPICPSRHDMDLKDEKQIKEYIVKSDCDAIIHCAAYTAVDKAEDEKDLCMKINATATKHIAQCAKLLDIPMIYISTDYVFDGNKVGEYTEDDAPKPINMYGKSKYMGEQYVRNILNKYYIVRTSWVFGINGSNFINTMLKLAQIKNSISVIDDQVGSPTYTVDLSRLLVGMIESDKYGTYHVTNEGYCSWCEFARLIFEVMHKDIEVIPISSSEYQCRAHRPLNSKLSKNKLGKNGFKCLPRWEEAVGDYFKQK